jgi:hypothetical protein
MNTVWWRAALALGSILAALPACVAARPASADQIAAFQALLRQAGVGPADTACVSVAVPGGERDPSPDVLTALRNASPPPSPRVRLCHRRHRRTGIGALSERDAGVEHARCHR